MSTAAAFVPEITSLTEVYPAQSQQRERLRWEHLLAKFEETYGHAAEFISRSPGRVNVIGEHIDYSLFSVLPMAVEADLLLAVRVLPEGSDITISNVLSKFPQRTFSVPAQGSGDLEIDSTKLEWSNYFKSGYRGALEFLRRNGVKMAEKPPGLEILVDGNVPGGGGLSSSAGFVCASALAGMLSMGVQDVDKKELVSLAVVSERYVGVNAGGMDQSASVLGEDGKALFISFDPELSADAVAFPKSEPEPVFLIANTYKTVEKHVTGPIHYNLRVVECTLAAELLGKKLAVGALPQDAGPLGTTLKGFMDTYLKQNPPAEGTTPIQHFEAMEKLAAETLTQTEGYTREEMAGVLGISVEELIKRYMTRFPIRAERFKLRDRALHVFSEAARVVKFYHILKDAEGQDPEEALRKLGTMMDQSQESCKNLFDCSCEELDELCRLAKEMGSYGSRLTGAGWGGCCVHMVPADKAEAVKKVWLEKYYAGKGLSEEELSEAIVVTKPGSGSVFFKVVEGVHEVL